MSNYYNPDNQGQQQPPHNPNPPQEKLVLGGFQDAPKSERRKPYQYQPPTPQSDYPMHQQGSQGQVPPQQYPQQAGQQPQHHAPPNHAQHAQQPQQAVNPAYTPQQGAQPPIPPIITARPPQRKRVRRKGGCAIGCLSVVLILVILGFLASNVLQHVDAFGKAVSTQSTFSTQAGYMNTSDRTNVLIMGFGGGTHDGAFLTDSLSVISLLPQSHHTSLVAVPRDLFVQYPPNSGQYTKINAIYPSAAGYTNKDPKAGGDAIAQKIALVTGLDVKFWVSIDFNGFHKLIDAIGGIDVYVPDSFNACYPNNDDANKDASWKKVQFNKGMEHMNGDRAITYARAREPLAVCNMGQSQNLAELTDFGRSARQQIMVKAVLAKVKQWSTWPHLYDAMDAMKSAIYTNMSLADLGQFALKMDLNDAKTARIGLSNQNVLIDDQSSDGQYILQPQNHDWGVIPKYVQQHLYN